MNTPSRWRCAGQERSPWCSASSTTRRWASRSPSAVTLWATQEAGQPSRFYSLAETDQSIAADFANFGQDPAKLKKKLRAAGVTVHDSFDPYAAAFKRQFGIGGNQAMELFHRTVSMKQVENITSFVRTNMLEEDDVEARIGNLIHHFDDLKKAHDAVLRAKDQIGLLTPIKEGAAQHAAADRRGRGRQGTAGPAARLVHGPEADS